MCPHLLIATAPGIPGLGKELGLCLPLQLHLLVLFLGFPASDPLIFIGSGTCVLSHPFFPLGQLLPRLLLRLLFSPLKLSREGQTRMSGKNASSRRINPSHKNNK